MKAVCEKAHRNFQKKMLLPAQVRADKQLKVKNFYCI